ncbi:uncharacterized protein LOC144109879 [Amblyomma americanum]
MSAVVEAISSQKEFMQRSVTVYPQLYEERRDQSEKLLLINDDYSLQLRKASVLPESVLLREVTGDGISDRYIGGVHLQRYLYEDKRKMTSLLLKPQAEGHYDIVGLLNATHRIDPEESRITGVVDQANENTPLPNNFPLELFFVSDFNHTMHFQKPEDHLEYVMLFVHSRTRPDELFVPKRNV